MKSLPFVLHVRGYIHVVVCKRGENVKMVGVRENVWNK